MKKILYLILMIVAMTNAAGISLEGHVPPDITQAALVKDYNRIMHTLDSSFVNDDRVVTIIYYMKNDAKMLGVRLPEWGGGGAIGADTIIIPVDRPYAFFSDDLYKITLHELVHIAIARTFGTIRVPRWFHEGLAMQLAGEITFEESVILSRAIVTHSLLTLDSIEYVNRFNQTRAQVAYSQSHFAMNYMTSLYGYDMLPELIDSARTVRRFDTACVRVFGLTTREFDSLVKVEMTKKYKYAFFYSDYEFWWIFIVALACVAFVVTIVRNRKKRRKMIEEEQAVESDDDGEDRSEFDYQVIEDEPERLTIDSHDNEGSDTTEKNSRK